MKALSWKPVKRGDRYCAPACGRGCTIQEYREAERKALKLALRLSSVDSDIKGGKWKPKLWENLGWHYQVTKGMVTVHEYNHRGYAAYLNIAGPWGGNKVVSASTPKLAVAMLLEGARAQLRDVVALAKRLEA